MLEWSQALLSAGIAVVVATFIIAVSKSTVLGMLAAGFLQWSCTAGAVPPLTSPSGWEPSWARSLALWASGC